MVKIDDDSDKSIIPEEITAQGHQGTNQLSIQPIEVPKTPEEQFIINAFKNLHLENAIINIEQHPEIVSRLADIGGHFKDAYRMAKIIQIILKRKEFQELKNKNTLTEEEMITCTLLHDIGKSGPPNISDEGRKLVQVLFPSNSIKNISQQTSIVDYLNMPEIRASLERNGMTKERAIDIIESELGGMKSLQNPEEYEPVLKFFRRHADWTEAILVNLWLNQRYSAITRNIIEIASCHHLLDGHDPYADEILDNGRYDKVAWEVQLFEFFEKQENLKKKNGLLIDLLTIVDKYQAFIDRSKMSHEGAITTLRKIMQDNKNLTKEDKQEYKTLINILDKAKEDIGKLYRQ